MKVLFCHSKLLFSTFRKKIFIHQKTELFCNHTILCFGSSSVAVVEHNTSHSVRVNVMCKKFDLFYNTTMVVLCQSKPQTIKYDKKKDISIPTEIGISLLLKLSHCFYAIAIHADKTNNAIAPWGVQKRSTTGDIIILEILF